jgi:O-antigen/teichoic acid export membrane protein
VSLGGATKRGIAWALSSNLANQVLQFAVGIVLARLLAPADFGVFATTGIFTGLAATVSNIGLGSALVQRAAIEERHRRTMLTANLVSSSLIVLLLWATSPAIAAYFRNPIAGPVLRLVALNFLLNAFSSVSFSLLSRVLNFRILAVTEAVAAAAFGLVAILLALRGYGVWAIAWAGLAQSLVRAVLLILRAGWPLRLGWDRRALADLLGLGAGLTLKRVINYAAANVDYAVIGRRLGPADLGYYTRAYGLITMPLHQFSRVIMTVLFPAFSRIQGDDARLIAGYSKVVTATAIVSFPFLVGLALVAPSFIAVIYGEKWLPTVLPLMIMCVAGMMKSVSTFVGAIADAKGQVQREVKRQLIYLGVLIAGTIAGSRYGTTGVAVAVVFASFLMLIMMQSFLGSLTGMRWRTFLGSLWPALAATLVMATAVIGAQAMVGRFASPTSLAMLVISTAVGMLVYPLVLLGGRFPVVVALRRELERDLAELRQRRRGGARPPSAVSPSPTCQESLP